MGDKGTSMSVTSGHCYQLRPISPEFTLAQNTLRSRTANPLLWGSHAALISTRPR